MNKPQTHTSESQFLTDQANAAKDAISACVNQIKADVRHGVDPRLWAKEYPWATLAAAAVGGFVTASMTVPSKEQQALKRLEKIERALHIPESERAASSAEKAKHKGIFSDIVSGALKNLQPILMSAITGAITGKVAQPSPDDLKSAADGVRTHSPTTHPKA